MTVDAAQVDPRQLTPGTRIRHRSGNVQVLSERKDDGSGWWLVGSGGLNDRVWNLGEWTVEPEPYEPALRCRRCHHFLMPHDVEGHDKWHDEPRR